MAHIDTDGFARYLSTFHETYSRTVETHVPEGMRGLLDRYSRLPCGIKGFVSTCLGVAFEYLPEGKGTHVVHGSSRIEDLFCGAPPRVRRLGTMFSFVGGNNRLQGLKLDGGFPFRLAPGATGPITFVDARFTALGWTRNVDYAEIYASRDAADWTAKRAVERAKDEVLQALTDVRGMEEENVSLARFLAGQKQRSVLVAGDFSPEGRVRLDAIRRALRALNYLPRLLDDVPEIFDYDLPEKFAAVATMARFVVIDDSSASGHVRELTDASHRGLLTIILRQEGSNPSFMTRADALKSTVMREFSYSGLEVSGPLIEATSWAEERVAELREQRMELYPWRSDAIT